MTGKEWLAAHDPEYVSPQQKAARTREIPYDLEALGEMLSGHTHAIKGEGGVHRQQAFVGFVGDAEAGTCQVDAMDDSLTAKPDAMVALADMESKRNRRGRRGGKRKGKKRK